MSDTSTTNSEHTAVPFVVTCGDEGVQINHGRRFAFVGAGLKLAGFEQALLGLRQVLEQEGFVAQAKQMAVAANEENTYVKQVLELNDFEEADASMQQHLQVLAKKHDLRYAGILPFADPLELAAEVKGHMVRPKGIHIANKICFTLAGGEQTYNLGQYLISADWLSAVDATVAKELLAVQVAFYESLAGRKLKIVHETEGIFQEATVAANLKILQELGYTVV
jgi:hypothetical protein